MDIRDLSRLETWAKYAEEEGAVRLVAVIRGEIFVLEQQEKQMARQYETMCREG